MVNKTLPPVLILILALALASCAPEEDDPARLPTGVTPPNSTPADVDGAIKPDPGATPTPTPTPVPFALVPARYTLSVPPSGGETPLFETSKTFALDPADAPAPVPAQWRSSDTQVAQVDAQGRVSALRQGTAIITASRRDGREATASVTVEARGRLLLNPSGLPSEATVVTRLYGADNTLLATSESGIFERASAGSLSAEVEARVSGRLVAIGRVEGMTLRANQLTSHEVPLNVPSLATTEVSGGPRATVTLKGSGLGNWVQRSQGALAPWPTSVTATVDGKPATATLAGDGKSVRLTAPATFEGLSPYRDLRLTVGGIPLTATYHLLEAIRIDTPTLTVPVLGRARFVASATNTNGQAVVSPGLAWEVRPYDDGPGLEGALVGGIDDTGEFTGWRAGKGLIVVHSGTLEATASVTVTGP